MVHLTSHLKMKWLLKRNCIDVPDFASVVHSCQIKAQRMHVLVVLQLASVRTSPQLIGLHDLVKYHFQGVRVPVT